MPARRSTSGTVDFNEQYAIDAVASTRFLTGTSKRLYESINQGDTLKDLGIALPTAPTSIVYGGKSGGVSNPDLLYVAANKIYFRQKAGATPTTLDNFPGGDAQFVAADPNNYKNVYAVNFFNQVFASSDAGVSWTEVTGNLGTLGNQIQTLTVYSTPDGSKVELLAGGLSLTGTQGGVFGLSNPGESSTTWTNLGGGLANAIVNQLLYDPTDDVLIASTLGRAPGRSPTSPRGSPRRSSWGPGRTVGGDFVPPESSAGGSSPFASIGPFATTTSTGTPVRLKDVNVTGGTEPVKYLTNVNGTIFFTQDDGTHGRELWKSDGTSAGTVLVKDIDPGLRRVLPHPPGGDRRHALFLGQ